MGEVQPRARLQIGEGPGDRPEHLTTLGRVTDILSHMLTNKLPFLHAKLGSHIPPYKAGKP